MAFVAGIHRRVDYAGGQQGALRWIGRFFCAEEILHVATEIAEMAEGTFVLQVKLDALYLAIDAGGIGEIRDITREHQRCGLETIGVFN